MGDLPALLTAIAGLVTALGGSIAVVITAVRTSRRERPAAAKEAAKQINTMSAELAKAAEDGVITPEELTAIAEREARRLTEGPDDDRS